MRSVIVRGLAALGALGVAWLLVAISDSGYLLQLWSQVFHEVGFGLIVAVLVWILFEVHIAVENDRVWSTRIERVSKGVFQAVLQKDLPRPLLDEAFNLVLDAGVIRESLSVAYTLSEAECETSPGVNADCIQMGAVVTCSMRNVSSKAEKLPISLRLPNPVHPKLKELCRVVSIRLIRDGMSVPLDLESAERAFRLALDTGQQTSAIYDAGFVDLGPQQKLDYRAEYVMAKETEDTEMFQTLYPADGLTLTITNQCRKRKRLIFARSVHRKYVEADAPQVSPDTRNLRISDYLLPHQGFLVWWKHAPDEPVSAEAAWTKVV